MFKTYKLLSENIENPLSNQKKVFYNLQNKLGIKGYAEFQETFPISEYESLIENRFFGLEDKCNFYVRTSGTNKSPKLIPISNEFLTKNHLLCSRQALLNLILHHKSPKVLLGNNLTLTGYKYSSKQKNKEVLDISALMFSSRPKIFKYIANPQKLYYSWKDKLNFLLSNREMYQELYSISGVPTWMMSLFSQLEEKFNLSIKEICPNLKLIIHGGVDFQNYFNVFQSIFNDRELKFYEVFNSTEGFIGFQYNPREKEILLSTNTSIFYEFRQNGQIYPLSKVDYGIYELIISTIDGLIRYPTGDLIEICSKNPLLFKYKGRITEFVNAFGEDLSISQTNEVVKQLSIKFNLNILDYFVVPKYPNLDEKGCHEWFFVLDDKLTQNKVSQKEIGITIDTSLQSINNNYKQKRNNSLALELPIINFIGLDQYNYIMSKSGKIEGGQAKLKRLYNNREILVNFNTYSKS